MKAPCPAIFAAILILSLIASGCASVYGPYFAEDPLTAEEHNNLGVIYEREGKYDLAVREYKRAASADRELVVPLVNLGNVYQKKGETEEAEKYYKKALKKDRRNIEAANNLASLYIETGENYEEGLEVLLAATETKNPVPAYALDTLGVLYFKTGNVEKAKEYLIEACAKASGDEKLKSEINTHLAEMGDTAGCR
ncbi:MAG: tetratricopeptide repeat protein [Thermodesulfobacteriota bacterium]